jgi:hypothetical protein
MYGNGESTKWFSQTLMTHKDKFYGTDGYLRISISTNTEDHKFFNPPLFNISISNNYQKSYNLNYHNASDLLKTLRLVKTQMNGDKSEIQRKYQKNMILYIQFFVEANNNNSVVDIRLLSSETDFTKIIIPIEMFSTLGKCLRYFVDSYFDICTQLLRESIRSESTQIIHQLPSLIKGISSQIVHQGTISDSRAPEPEVEKVTKIQTTIDDLDDFLGNDMENITVPELNEEKKAPIVEVDSLFVKHLLKNDLSNLENMMNNHMMNPDPIMTFASEVQNKLGPEIKGDFTLLPDINNDDLKSLLYMSKLYNSIAYMNHFAKDIPLPNSMPVFKYNPKTVSPENIEIAYDLLLFNLYIRSVRSKLEGKSADIAQNKALFHIQLRCFTDPFTFSFIGKEEINNLKSVIYNRYRYYDSIGVFDKYKDLLKTMHCPEIKDYDISSSVIEAIDKVIGKSPNINILHSKSAENNNFRLASKNNFTLEQIINEIIPLEVAEKLGKDIKNEEVLKEINRSTPISDEILNFFIKGKTQIKIKKENAFNNNLERITNFFSDEIPDQHKEKFIKHIQKLNQDKFNLKTDEFPLDEFGENIIRALYLWDPKGNPQSYKQYQINIKEETMNKNLILAKVKAEEPEEAESDEWNFLSK